MWLLKVRLLNSLLAIIINNFFFIGLSRLYQNHRDGQGIRTEVDVCAVLVFVYSGRPFMDVEGGTSAPFHSQLSPSM